MITGLKQDDQDDPGGDLRAGDHRAVVQRRGRRAGQGERCPVRAVLQRLDPGSQHRVADVTRSAFSARVWINTHIPLAAEMPHGGFGPSGYGKDLSGYGLEDYTRVKHVMSSLD